MFTDTKGLLSGGMELVVAAWEEAHEAGWDWREMDRYIMHQVSDVHVNSITKAANLDPDRSRSPIRNWVTSAPHPCPSPLGREASNLNPGDRILCMGVGSGLNPAMTEIEW